MNPTLERIHALLANEQDEVARTCEEILQSGSPGIDSFDLSLKRTRDIYYRRAELNADSGGSIKGFENLVSNLKKESEPMIGIQSVTVGPRQFIAFTTPDVTRLIGLLVFPANSDTRFKNSTG
jgi:hypothetical protein